VLLVRPAPDSATLSLEKPRRILLPLDGTPSSATALGPALDLADRTEAEIDVLYVATQTEPSREPGSLTGPIYIDQAQYEWDDWAQEFATRFGTALGQYMPTMPIRVYVRGGDPPEEIVAFARERESDLIVLQWHLRAHGEVVNRVLVQTPCPMLLLPPQERSQVH
jgi:nucleotide-binding universal stress UspA family protein